ncbi:MAG TPA: hypothetical protein VID19_08045 [Candidatus Eremiobacteraceae bacterium]|jgi:hypothetical protein
MMTRTITTCVLLALLPAAVASCVPKTQPPPCCATLGYNRIQVESVLGKPSPPQTSRYHPLPSPPPGAAIYTTEHGYLTVTYFGMTPAVAQHISLDFFEGKDPTSGFALAAIYLPSDAHDVAHATGAKYQIRLFTSTELSRTVPASGGKIYVECAGPNPSRECDTMEIGAGNP